MRWTPYWLAHGGCVEPAGDWTRVEAREGGLPATDDPLLPRAGRSSAGDDATTRANLAAWTWPLRSPARIWHLTGRWLPDGWLDALRQIALFGGAYYAYRIVRGFVDGQATLAFENARTLVDWERAMGLFFEPALQAWAKGEDWLMWIANWMYVNSHFVVTTTFLIWLYIARNHAYYFVRNMFMVAMGFALVGYMAYPTAPPRFLPEWGFTDTVGELRGRGAPPRAPTCSTTRTPRCRACTWPSR